MAKYQYVEGRGVPLLDPETGRASYYPEAEAVAMLRSGAAQAATMEAANEQEIAGLRQQAESARWDMPVKAGIAGALRGATFGLSDVVGATGGAGDFLEKLQEQNPKASIGGEIAGAIGSGLIPGGPVAQLGRAGLATKAATKALLGGGEAAQAARLALRGEMATAAKYGLAGEGALAEIAGSTARGVAEGVGFGAGTAVSEFALREEALDDLPGTIARHLATGAAFGGALGLGTAGVVGAGKWAMRKAGVNKPARDLLEARAKATEVLEAEQANSATLKAAEEAKLFKPEARAGMEAEVARIEAVAEARTKDLAKMRSGPAAAGAEEDVYSIAKMRLRMADKMRSEIGLAEQENASAAQKLAVAKEELVGLGPEPKAAKLANEELAKHVASVERLRRDMGDAGASLPRLPQRLEAVLEYLRGKDPEAVARALEKGTFKGQVDSLSKSFLPKMERAPANRLDRFVALEELGPGLKYGPLAKQIAIDEFRALSGASKTGGEWTWESALKQAAKGATDTVDIHAARRAELAQAVAGLQQEADLARARLATVKANWKAAGDAIPKPSEERLYRDAVARLEAEGRAATGEAAKLEELKRALAAQDEIKARIAALEAGTPEEQAARAALEGIATKTEKGEAGLLGRLVQSAATRTAKWTGARAISRGLGATGGMMSGGGGIVNTGKLALGYEVARAFAPKLVQGLSSLVAGTAGNVGRAGEAVFGLSEKVGRVIRPAVQQESIRHLSKEEYDTIAADLRTGPAAWETMARAALIGEPEDLANAVVASHKRQRDFLESVRPKSPNEFIAAQTGQPVIPTTGGKWRPSSLEREKFGRYVRAATSWKNVVEDLVDRRATPESMEALRAVYPDVADALRVYVQNGVRRATAEGKKYGPSEARMIDLVLGPPYQTLSNLSVLQATFQQQQRVEPSRGRGPAVSLSKDLMNQLQQTQAGLAKR